MRTHCLHLLAIMVYMVGFSATGHADKLCLKVAFNRTTQKVATSSTIAAVCPRGYKQLADTSLFKGDKGDKGDTGASGTNGTNGANGTNGFVPLSQCIFGTTTGASCAEGLICTTELECGSVAGAAIGDYMIAWDFNVGAAQKAYVVDVTQLIPVGFEYPTGVRVKTTSEDGFGAHIPTVSVFCCPS